MASGLQRFFDLHGLTVVFLASVTAHIPFLFGRYLPRESLKYFSADENALIRVIEDYQDHIMNGHWWALLTERLEYGYGYLFYLSYSILTYPFALMAGDEGVLAAGRIISMLLESGAIIMVCLIAKRLAAPAWLAALIGVAMAFTPGLMVMHKPLSAEPLSNFLIVAAAWCVLAMPLQSFRKNLFLISALAGAAISVKFNAAMEGVFFAVAILIRLWRERAGLFRTALKTADKVRTIAIDFGVMAAGLLTFLLWNVPIMLSASSRDNFIGWLVIQAQSNQNSQRGKVNYRGVDAWWPKIDAYFGDNVLLPWLLLSGVAALIIGLILKKGKDISLYAFLALLWLSIPAAYVILTVKKIWLWYLTLPALSLLLGPALLYVAARRLCDEGRRIWGDVASTAAIVLLVAQIWTALPDYAAFASIRWQETERPDFIEMEAMRATLTNEVAGKLDKTSMIVDQRVTLPVDAWREAGADIKVNYLPTITVDLIKDVKPDYIVIRHWAYAHHRGNREKALADFNAKLETACQTAQACYEEHWRFDQSKTIVFKAAQKTN